MVTNSEARPDLKRLNRWLIVVSMVLLLIIIFLKFYIIPKHNQKEEEPIKENIQIKNV